MTVVTVTRSAWTQLNSVAQRLQVFGGRIQVADNATPGADDWLVFPEGAVVDVTANRWGRAVDNTPTWVVTQAV